MHWVGGGDSSSSPAQGAGTKVGQVGAQGEEGSLSGVRQVIAWSGGGTVWAL